MTSERNPVEAQSPHSDWVKRARSMWIRARTNAFAHKVALEQLTMIGGAIFILETMFVVIPIVCVGLSLHNITSAQQPAPGGAASSTAWLAALGIIAILGNGLALLLNMLATHFQWSEQRLVHRNMLAGYQLIAQKARRLDDRGLEDTEGDSLCHHLEEIFEVYKAMGIEPNDRAFSKANGYMAKLKAYPFGITPEEFL